MELEKNYIIQSATSNDLDQIAAINNAVIENSTANYDWEPHERPFYDRWFKQKQDLGLPVVVAKCKEEVLAFATYSQFRNKVGYRYCMEHSVYVKEGCQGKGIGSALLSKIIELAIENDVHVLIAGVDSSNFESIRFHERFGFKRVAEMKEVGRKFNRWLDLTFLQLLLQTDDDA